MSESEEDVTVDADGVSIRKTLNDHQFETLAVVLDVRSGRDRAAFVTVTDVVPDGVEEDDIGFHPEYGGEHWQAEDGRIVFARTFEPGEQYTTVYGVRDFDRDRGSLLAEPAVEIGPTVVGEGGESAGDDAVRGIDDLVSEADSEVVREVISGERDTLPGLEEASTGDGEGPVEVGEAAEAADDGRVEATIGEADAASEVGEEEPVEAALHDDRGYVESEPGDDGFDVETETEAASSGADADEGTPETAAAEDGTPEAEATAAEGAEAEATAADVAEDETTGSVEEADDRPGVEADEAAGEEAIEADAAAGGDAIEADVEAEDLTETDAVADEEPEERPASTETAAQVTVPVTGGIARVLAKELRAGNVSYEDRRLLREELLPQDGSTDARIKHLQAQMADLVAYTDALEQFLDDEGGAEAVLGEIGDDVDGLAEDLRGVEETTQDLEGNVEDVEGGIEGVEGRVEGAEGRIEGVEETVGSLADGIERVEGDLHEVSGDVEQVSGDVEQVSGDVEQVSGIVDRLEDDVASIEDDVARVAELDRRLGGVEDDVTAIHDELAELATFRDRLSSVFGPGGGGGIGDRETGGEGPEAGDEEEWS